MTMAPIIIEVAINGGVTPDRNPHVPLKAADITADCFWSGGYFASSRSILLRTSADNIVSVRQRM